ncbi:MAG: cupin domain-containing protein [Fibrobacterota bacterium]
MKSARFTDREFVHKNHKVSVAELYHQKDAQAMHIRLKPGEELLPHKTPVDVFFYVLAGTVTVVIGDEDEAFAADTLIESPAYITHTLKNTSEKETRVLVVKTPAPNYK